MANNSTPTSSGFKNSALARARAILLQNSALVEAIEKSTEDPTPEQLALLNELNATGHRATASFGGAKGSKKSNARAAYVASYNNSQ